MSDIETAEHADIVDDVTLTRAETLILKEFAGELLAKVEAQRKRDAWNAHARMVNSRGSGPVYKPTEPTAPPPPAPVSRAVIYRREAGSTAMIAFYADDGTRV